MSRVGRTTFYKNTLRIDITHRMPSCVDPQYWHRHLLTIRDIQTIVSYVPAHFIWLICLIHQIDCPWFALRPTMCESEHMTISAKSTAIRLLLAQYPNRISHNRLNIDSTESLCHIPPLPAYVIKEDIFSQLRTGISPSLMPRCLLATQIPSIPFILSYLGFDWLPVAFEGSAICCTRVVKESIYTSVPFVSPGGDGFTHAPMVCIYNDIVYCLTDESVLFSTP